MSRRYITAFRAAAAGHAALYPTLPTPLPLYLLTLCPYLATFPGSVGTVDLYFPLLHIRLSAAAFRRVLRRSLSDGLFRFAATRRRYCVAGFICYGAVPTAGCGGSVRSDRFLLSRTVAAATVSAHALYRTLLPLRTNIAIFVVHRRPAVCPTMDVGPRLRLRPHRSLPTLHSVPVRYHCRYCFGCGPLLRRSPLR